MAQLPTLRDRELRTPWRDRLSGDVLRFSGRLELQANNIEEAIRMVLRAGYRTPDIDPVGNGYAASTSEIGELVTDALAEIADLQHAYHAV